MIPTVSALRLLGSGRERGIKPIDLVRRGLASASIDKLSKLLGISTEELARVIGLSRATMHRRRASGSRLRPDESDRIFRVASAFAAAQDVFESGSNGAAWLRNPNRVLAGKRPLDLLDTEIGFVEVLRLLGHIEHGIGP